mmetsp:Transcript_28452/g.51955  ORF Transcript_28452/g.51955 Transcript_28452/m.51955 type:complete len:581 (+) Transcript_28452:1121-2863(+)
MVHQRGTQRNTQRSPSSAGFIKGISNDASISPHSANSVDVYKSRLYNNPTNSQHNDAQSCHSHGTSGPESRSSRPQRFPHPAAAIPGADPRLLMRHRRGGRSGVRSCVSGFEDPSYDGTSASGGVNGVNETSSKSNNDAISKVPIPIAVLLWYFLGVISIASSKVLLSTHNVSPLVLTVQQLVIGMTLLRTLLEMQTSGGKDEGDICGGLQPIPMQGDDGTTDTKNISPEKFCEAISSEVGMLKGNFSSKNHGVVSAILALRNTSKHAAHIHKQLFLAAIYFALGFLLTNYGFQSAEASFVETVKAAEPFTSATVAVVWGIERLGKEEVASLTGIVAGVVLSTLGHRGSGKATIPSTMAYRGASLGIIPSQSLASKCLVVMLSNLCFSFRGLHQKLFRASPGGHASAMSDINLQYRMQQIGVLMLIVPTLLGNTLLALDKLRHAFTIGGSAAMKYAFRYVLLSFVNGIAFTSYNLASTFVLTRISVVHHAALNCIRRVFAIVVTSVLFGSRMTMLQFLGIALAVVGFFSYIHHKLKKEIKEKRRKELRKKWGGIMMDTTKGERRWIRKSSSLLPINTIGN